MYGLKNISKELSSILERKFSKYNSPVVGFCLKFRIFSSFGIKIANVSYSRSNKDVKNAKRSENTGI
jgi:hypothetical protein